jgi:DUF4097 and DUF4098 domain-containing protein YvlB
MRKFVGATIVAVLGATGVAAQSDIYREEVSASAGEHLELRLRTGGSVHIVGTDLSSVRVEATKRGRDAADVEIRIRRVGRRTVQVVSEYDGRPDNRSSNISFVIQVPRRFDIELDSMGGEVRIEDVEGEIRGGTMGGELTLARLRGRLNLSTMGGNIELRDSQVDGSVSTMGGTVTLEDVTGNVNGSSMGGNVVYRNVRRSSTSASSSPSSSMSTAKEVRISTMGGDVNVADATAGANVSTMGGNIRIAQAAQYVKASTMGGNIRLDSLDGWVEASTMGGDVIVTMVGDPERGDRHVKLTSMGGDITLNVPASLGMRFDITLAYTRNSKQNYEIRSDFPIQTRRTSEWERTKGDARRYVYGTGTVGSGRHVIEIETVNGNVNVRRTP